MLPLDERYCAMIAIKNSLNTFISKCKVFLFYLHKVLGLVKTLSSFCYQFRGFSQFFLKKYIGLVDSNLLLFVKFISTCP